MYTLKFLKSAARPLDAIETTIGGNEYCALNPPTISTRFELEDAPNVGLVAE